MPSPAQSIPSPTQNHHLEVDEPTEEPEEPAPENLSLKKPSPETPPPTQIPTVPVGQFVPYHFQAFQPFQPHLQQQYVQRSPVDILLRVFPGRRRSDVEALLQR